MNPLSHNRNFVETRESENENRQTPTPPARFVKRAVKHPAPAPAARRVRERDTPGLRFLLKQTAPERETLSELLSLAREEKLTEAVALLLEEQRRRFPPNSMERFAL